MPDEEMRRTSEARVKRSGATEGSATTFSRGVYIPRAILKRKLELVHGVQLVHMPNDVFHFAFAMDFPRDVLERIHDLRIHPLVHILDDFIVMIVMRVHIQRLVRFRGQLFLALGDGDDIAVIFVFKGVSIAFIGVPVRETFNHPELITENILDGDESENEEYA